MRTSPAKPPGRAPFGGYIYVIEFSDGISKVGSTRNARQRINHHRTTAGRFGVSLAQTWWSGPLYAFEDAETRLISASTLVATVARPREWFTDVWFAALVGLAEVARDEAVRAADDDVRVGQFAELVARTHFGTWRKFVAACKSGEQEHVVSNGRPALTQNQIFALQERRRAAA